jgi:hypothetical protein
MEMLAVKALQTAVRVQVEVAERAEVEVRVEQEE